VDQTVLSTVVVGACALVWLVALAVGIWRVRHRRDRRGLMLTVLAATALLIAVVVYTGTTYGTKISAAIHVRLVGPPAILVTSWQGRGELHYHIGSRTLSSTTQDGRFSVETGTLTLESYSAFGTAGATTWEGRTTLSNVKPLVLQPGQQQPLQVGPPYTARVEVGPQLKSLALKVKDAGGHDATVSDPGHHAPPSLEVLDARGQVVFQGKFSYG